MTLKNVFSLITCLLLIVSCKKDNNSTNLDVPETYHFERDGISTVSFTGQTERILMATELVNTMLDFDNSSEKLIEMYANQSNTGMEANPFDDDLLNASSKNIKSKIAASYDFFYTNTTESAVIKAQLQSWIESQVITVFPNNQTLASIGVAGQIADGTTARYVNEQGLELNQLVAKSMIGALMVDQMCNHYLSRDILDDSNNKADNDNQILVDEKPYTQMEHYWDEAYGYLFGLSTDAASPLSTLGEDKFLNEYLSKVEGDNDFEGIADDIFNAFKRGRAAIIAGEYSTRDEQAEILKKKISEIVAIRTVYYLQNGKIALVTNNLGAAFHSLSEAVGFIYSLRFLRQANSVNPYFTRSDVDQMMDMLIAENGLWEVTAETLDHISELIAAKFDFTVAQAAQ